MSRSLPWATGVVLAIGLTIALALVLAATARPACAEEPHFRIQTYNIYWGGHDYDPVFNRGLEWLQVLREEQADVVVLQECLGWLDSESGYLRAYVDSLNATLPAGPYYQGYAGVGSWILHVCLISRHPVTHFEYFNQVVVDGETIPISRVFVHAAIDLYGAPVHVVGVHFKSGLSRVDREAEARALLAILDDLPAGATVWVLGDFNSYSPDDVAEGSATPPDYAHGASPAELIGWEPIGYLRDRGYEDAYRSYRPLSLGYTQETTDFLPTGPGPIKRVDCILRSPTNGWIRTSAHIRDDALGDAGSDHYSVIADYERAAAATPEVRLLNNPIELSAQPNPFAADCLLRMVLPTDGPAELALFSPSGRLVRSEALRPGAGLREWTWNGRGALGEELPSGVYLARVGTASASRSIKIWKLGGR